MCIEEGLCQMNPFDLSAVMNILNQLIYLSISILFLPITTIIIYSGTITFVNQLNGTGFLQIKCCAKKTALL